MRWPLAPYVARRGALALRFHFWEDFFQKLENINFQISKKKHTLFDQFFSTQSFLADDLGRQPVVGAEECAVEVTCDHIEASVGVHRLTHDDR